MGAVSRSQLARPDPAVGIPAKVWFFNVGHRGDYRPRGIQGYVSTEIHNVLSEYAR